jgi:hypothetical protein
MMNIKASTNRSKAVEEVAVAEAVVGAAVVGVPVAAPAAAAAAAAAAALKDSTRTLTPAVGTAAAMKPKFAQQTVNQTLREASLWRQTQRTRTIESSLLL